MPLAVPQIPRTHNTYGSFEHLTDSDVHAKRKPQFVLDCDYADHLTESGYTGARRHETACKDSQD
jgi:hypothetical protein